MAAKKSKPKTGSKAGRKSILDQHPEKREEILKVLRDGNFQCVAYGAVGIGKDAFYEYLKKNAEFAEAVKRAEIQAEMDVVKPLKADAVKGDNTARIYYLKHRFRSRWGEHVQIEMGEQDKGGVPTVQQLFDRTIQTTAVELSRLTAKSLKTGLTSEEHKNLISLNKSILEISDQQRKYDQNAPERNLSDEELLKLAPKAIKILKDNKGNKVEH